MKLNPNAQKWVDALRSGKYQQGQGVLRTFDGRFCCLGVACDVAAKEGIGKWDDQNRFLDKTAWLPDEVMKWLGMKDQSGAWGRGELLTRENDVHRLTFPQIADLIEEHAEELGVSA